jgi:hypothetical protein
MSIDKQKALEEQITPLAKQIYEICEANGIPCVMSFQRPTKEAGVTRMRNFVFLPKEAAPDDALYLAAGLLRKGMGVLLGVSVSVGAAPQPTKH